MALNTFTVSYTHHPVCFQNFSITPNTDSVYSTFLHVPMNTCVSTDSIQTYKQHAQMTM